MENTDQLIRAKDIKLVPLSEIKLNPKNRNTHPKEQIEHLVKIIRGNGFRRPGTISNQSGFLTCGEGRYLAAKSIGLTHMPCMFQDYDSPELEYADGVADNALDKQASLDLSAINVDLGDLGPDFDIDMLGLKDFVLEPADKLPAGDEDEVPEVAQPKSKLGDVYELGGHRLMCGDSTQISDIEKLMNGELADLWLTDPPYGVDYESSGRRGKDNQHEKIENDSKPLEQMKVFWQDVGTNAFAFCTDKSSYYWFACQGGDQMMMMMMMALGDSGWQVKHELIWLKDQMVFGRADYHYKHEPIIYGWKRGGTHEWTADRKQVSVLEFARPKKSEEHPTMKPVELVEYLMGNNSKPGQLVLETFGGSGTTLIAAEKSGRRCYAIEISPHYVDVIVARWCKYTGQTKVKLNGEEIEWANG